MPLSACIFLISLSDLDIKAAPEALPSSTNHVQSAATATEVLNAAKRTAPLQSLVSGRPKSMSIRRPSSASQSPNQIVRQIPDPMQIAASASLGGLSVATAAVATNSSTASVATANGSPRKSALSEDVNPDDEELDTKSLNEDEVEAIKELFSKYDINNDGAKTSSQGVLWHVAHPSLRCRRH